MEDREPRASFFCCSKLKDTFQKNGGGGLSQPRVTFEPIALKTTRKEVTKWKN